MGAHPSSVRRMVPVCREAGTFIDLASREALTREGCGIGLALGGRLPPRAEDVHSSRRPVRRDANYGAKPTRSGRLRSTPDGRASFPREAWTLCGRVTPDDRGRSGADGRAGSDGRLGVGMGGLNRPGNTERGGGASAPASGGSTHAPAASRPAGKRTDRGGADGDRADGPPALRGGAFGCDKARPRARTKAGPTETGRIGPAPPAPPAEGLGWSANEGGGLLTGRVDYWGAATMSNSLPSGSARVAH
jgi:hypothetical protein